MQRQPEVEGVPGPTSPETASGRRILRRVGCGCALIIWFVILLIPCFCAALAINQEIVVSTGSVPGQGVRIWLIMEAESRGIGISTGSLASDQPLTACVQTDNRFLLWAGQSGPVTNCDCYARSDTASPWLLASVNPGVCTGG